MGKHANQWIWRQFDRQMDSGLDEAMGEPPLTEAERAASWESWFELRREADIDFVEMMR